MIYNMMRVSNLKRAKVVIYDKDKSSYDVPGCDAYAYLYYLKEKNIYINVFNPYVECNVYKKKNNKNSNIELELVDGKEKNGICYILDEKVKGFEGCGLISYNDLADMLIHDLKDFYPDRWHLVFEDKNVDVKLSDKKKILKNDYERLNKFNERIGLLKAKKYFKKMI